MSSNAKLNQLIEHLFRHDSGRIVATLTRIFGVQNLQLAEDVVQETLMKAMQQWSYKGVPDNPSAWLMTVAKNNALDVLRRQKNHEQKLSLLGTKTETQWLEDTLNLDTSIKDDLVAMLFMGCHPSLSQEMQITLLLKTLGGFSVSEIAHAFLLPEATIAQRIVRAKRKLREHNITFDMPPDSEFETRLDAVLVIIYLIFSEGYKASEGNHLIRRDLCHEAIRLCEIISGNPKGNLTHVHALMALMLFQIARFDTRITNGQLRLLSEQDRSLWNQNAIQLGLYHLEHSTKGHSLSSYHLQAGIAACHTLAPTYAETDWQQILIYYEQLLQLEDSLFVRLNYAVALSHTQNVKVALEVLKQLDGLGSYYLYHATLADFERRLGNLEIATSHYQTALELTQNTVEKSFIEKQIASISCSDKTDGGF